MTYGIPKSEFEALTADGLTVPQIATALWIGRSTVRRYLALYGLRAKSLKDKLAKGRTFNELEVIKYVGTVGVTTLYLCRCLRCRKKCTVRRTDLVGLKQKTCGCVPRARGKNHHNFTGHEEINGSYWASVRAGAVARNLEFDVTIEHAWQLFAEQAGRCALSGQQLVLANGAKATASLDRIDSSEGYVVGNVQWVHKDINRMKMHLSEDYFISLCKQVADHRTTASRSRSRTSPGCPRT